jgi:hypothetical protein
MTMRLSCLLQGHLLAGWLVLALSGGDTGAAESDYARWTHGPPGDPAFFPIAVWLQPPAKAERYKAAGINTYVALWRGPTEEQLAVLKKAEMKLICHQNRTALDHVEDATIIGWMHGDEPDNAQSLGEGKGYGPPVLPEKIVQDYARLRASKPSRPVLLNLGQGVAWDNWYGRGVRSRHPEDYPEYIKGCDIVSFDIYPVVHEHPEVSGKLERVAYGVKRLVDWAKGEKVVWNCIECTRIGHPTAKATPAQVKAEVWMSLVHGSKGLIYFVHEWKPKFNESALLDDSEMLAAVTDINHQIATLAPVLNSPDARGAVEVRSSDASVPVAVLSKRQGEALYVFAVAMRDAETAAAFKLTLADKPRTVEVLGENRTLAVVDGGFSDHFRGWGVHLYRLK